MSAKEGKQVQKTWNPEAKLGKLVPYISYSLLKAVFWLMLLNSIVTLWLLNSIQGTVWQHTSFTLSASATNVSTDSSIPSGFAFNFNDTRQYEAGMSTTWTVVEFAEMCAINNFAASYLIAVCILSVWAISKFLPPAGPAKVEAPSLSLKRQLRILGLVIYIVAFGTVLFAILMAVIILLTSMYYFSDFRERVFLGILGLVVAGQLCYRPACEEVEAGAVRASPGENGQLPVSAGSGEPTAYVAGPDDGSLIVDTGLFRVETAGIPGVQYVRVD